MTKELMSLLLGFLLIESGCSFWWPPPPTTKPPETVLKQIPLTYFRTYTYQPFPPNPFAYPFFGGFGGIGGAGAMGGFPSSPFLPQTPLLSGSHYNPLAAAQTLLATVPPATTTTTTTKTTPTTSTSITTTTSTTTPPPPPTASTTITTTTTTTPVPPPPSTTPSTTTSTPSTKPTTTPAESYRLLSNDASDTTTILPLRTKGIPDYNRRPNFVNSAFKTSKIYRPVIAYSYPDYSPSTFHPTSMKLDSLTSNSHASSPQVQFVPCMCPISIGLTTEFSRGQNDLQSTFLMEARTVNTADGTDGEAKLPRDEENAKNETMSPDVKKDNNDDETGTFTEEPSGQELMQFKDEAGTGRNSFDENAVSRQKVESRQDV